MSIQDSKTKKRRWPLWILLIGLLGIGNFVVGFWSLLPPGEGDTVYFWLVRFYSYTFIPMLIILPVSMIIVTLWFSDLAERSWLQDTIILVGIVMAMFCCYLAFVILYFAPTIRYVAHIEQNNRFIIYWGLLMIVPLFTIFVNPIESVFPDNADSSVGIFRSMLLNSILTQLQNSSPSNLRIRMALGVKVFHQIGLLISARAIMKSVLADANLKIDPSPAYI